MASSAARCALRRVTGFRIGHVSRRECSSTSNVVALAALPPLPLQPAEGLPAVLRLLSAAQTTSVFLDRLWADEHVESFLSELGAKCEELDVQQLREVLVAFSRAGEMPEALWLNGLAGEVPRMLEELPDLHVVHTALLMANLGLREPRELLALVADQLDSRSPSLTPQGLAGAIIALSQLGPWPEPLPGGMVMENLLGVWDQLGHRELSASALAVATMGIGSIVDWHKLHVVLAAQAPELLSRHMADVLLALATTQLCPISLLEALQDRLPAIAVEMEPDEALTTAWALSAMQIFPRSALPQLLEGICEPGDAELTSMQRNQLRQVMLSFDLDPGAKRVAGEVPADLRERLRDACADAMGDNLLISHLGDDADDELSALLAEAGSNVSRSKEAVEGFYTVNVAINPPSAEAAPAAVLLDAAASLGAQAPNDPWVTLKVRHLKCLGWKVTWMPAARWHALDEEGRGELVGSLTGA